jgi:hypothetical protein
MGSNLAAEGAADSFPIVTASDAPGARMVQR